MKRLGLCLVVVGVMSASGAITAWAGDPVPGVDVSLEQQLPDPLPQKPQMVLKSEGVPIEPGAPLGAFSQNLIFVTAAGNLECEENRLEGTLLTNKEKAKDKASFTRASLIGNFEGIPGACKTSATGPVYVEAGGFPWPTEFSKKGAGKVKGSKKIAFTETFLALEPPNNKCTFEASTVKFSFPISVTPQPLIPTITKQKFKHNKKAPNQTPLCPSEGTMSGSVIIDVP